MTLAVVNYPGSQEDMVSNWEPAHSFVEDAVSGAKIAARVPLALAGAHLLSASGARGHLYGSLFALL